MNDSIVEKIIDKKRSKTKAVLLLLCISVVFVLLSLLATKWYENQSITSVKISGNTVLSTGEISSIIDSLIMNVPSNGVKLSAIKDKLLSNEYIGYADVWFNSKGVLGIEIKERVPIGIVVNPNGELHFVDQTGTIFSYRLYKEYTDLVVISNIYEIGKYGKESIDNAALSGAIQIIKELQNKLDGLNKIISEIKYIPKSRTYELFLTEFGIKINFGRTDNIAEKLENINIFWKNKLLFTSNKQSFNRIDARWNDVIIVSN
jgi:cell division protein FtsQ